MLHASEYPTAIPGREPTVAQRLGRGPRPTATEFGPRRRSRRASRSHRERRSRARVKGRHPPN
eukprot:15460063-Alexandrium_andersonii.AAC.1